MKIRKRTYWNPLLPNPNNVIQKLPEDTTVPLGILLRRLIQESYIEKVKTPVEANSCAGKVRMIIPLKLNEVEKTRYEEVREYRKKYGVPMFTK